MCWDSFGRISHILHPQSRKCTTRGRPRDPKLLLQLEPLLSPQPSLLGLLLLRAAMPALKENRPAPAPAPCVAGGSSVATKACRTATGLRDRETGRACGKAQVNTAALRPMWAGGAAAEELAGGDPEGSGKGKVQSSTFKYVPDTDGKAGPGKKPAPPAVQQADGESSLSFQRGGSAGLRDPQSHRWQLRCPGRVAGAQGAETHREREEGQRGPLQRRGQWQSSCFFQQWDIICVVL